MAVGTQGVASGFNSNSSNNNNYYSHSNNKKTSNNSKSNSNRNSNSNSNSKKSNSNSKKVIVIVIVIVKSNSNSRGFGQLGLSGEVRVTRSTFRFVVSQNAKVGVHQTTQDPSRKRWNRQSKTLACKVGLWASG